MKRSIGLLALTLALSATLVGCSNTASTDPVAPDVAATESPAPTTTPNTVAQGIVGDTMVDMGRAARGAMDDMGRAVHTTPGSVVQNQTW